jgi:hypothetical protein
MIDGHLQSQVKGIDEPDEDLEQDEQDDNLEAVDDENIGKEFERVLVLPTFTG